MAIRPSTEETQRLAAADAQRDAHPSEPEEQPVVARKRTAADALLRADDRNRKVVIAELLRDLGLGGSDAARCVKLGAAKLAYQDMYPWTKHGAAPKPKGRKDAKSASLPFEKYAEKLVGGWKPRTIARWCSIGETLAQDAYEKLLGTPLANDLGRLEKLTKLPEPDQVSVATKYGLLLEREARDLLDRITLHREREADDDHVAEQDRLEVQAPPSGARMVEVEKSPDGAVCILNEQIVEVVDLGDRLRLTLLGKANKTGRPAQVAIEDWTDGVVKAVTRFRAEHPEVTLDLSPITWVPPTDTANQHHITTITATRPDGVAAVLHVRRWGCLADIGYGDKSGPMNLPGDAGHVWLRANEPVVAVSQVGFPTRNWPEGNYDHAERVEYRLRTWSLPELLRFLMKAPPFGTSP
jgi:hypothetical protein